MPLFMQSNVQRIEIRWSAPYVIMRSRAIGSITYISLGFQSRHKSLHSPELPAFSNCPITRNFARFHPEKAQALTDILLKTKELYGYYSK